MLFSFGFWFGIAVGAAIVWYGKATIQNLFSKTSSTVSALEADVAAVKAKITPVSTPAAPAPVAPAPAPAPVIHKSS